MAKTILVVDDSKTLKQQISFTLTKGGFAVVEAADGNEGLEKLRSTPNVALIISDINMPGMNGIDFLKAAKADPALKHISVLMLTTETEPKLIMEAKAAGAKGFMVKPFDPSKLTEVVNKLTP